MHSGVFKTGDCDNLNHKKSNLVNDELHGVAISLSNNLSQENLGVTHNTVLMNQSPSTFKILPDHLLCNNSSYGSYWSTPVSPGHHGVQGSRVREEVGINHISGLMSKEELQVGNVVTRSGFHSSQEDASPIKPPAEIGILAIFPDKYMEALTDKHVMHLVQKCIQFLNSGQTPVNGADQSLYALAKPIFPAVLHED